MTNTRKLAYIAILSAVSFLLLYFSFPYLLFSEQEELMRLFVTLLHTQIQMLNLDYLIQDFQ